MRSRSSWRSSDSVRTRSDLARARACCENRRIPDLADTPPVEPLAAAYVALAQRDWAGAQAHCERALAAGESPAALEGLAVARWWQDDVDAAIAARERAYALRRDRGETLEAARVAGFLAWDYGAMRGVGAVANGWLQRARHLIADLEPSAEHAWLPLIEASFFIDTDAARVLELAREAATQARVHGALDIEMTARTLQGLALVSMGQMDDGTRLLDEGTAAATAGELHDPIAIGSCWCNMIMACERARDYDRAGQWCEQLTAFCRRTGQRPLLAMCRAHHGTVQMMRGDWAAAEQDLEWASGELARLRPPLAGYARARLAQLRRRQGRPRDARALLTDAAPHALAWLVSAEVSLDADDPAGAHAHAERYLRSASDGQPIERAAAFELLVPITIRAGDLPAARGALAALTEIADAVDTPALRAAGRCGAGRVAMASSDLVRARVAFEDATDLYTRTGMPFDAAITQVELARVLAAEGRDAAALELALAARATFAGLGASTELKAADRLVTRLGGGSRVPGGADLTARELDVLRLVAQGLSNRRVAEHLVVSEHTVHRHMANIYARLGVSTRAAAVALASDRDLLH